MESSLECSSGPWPPPGSLYIPPKAAEMFPTWAGVSSLDSIRLKHWSLPTSSSLST